jgi:SAM-dependent methyltransferase
MKELYGAVFYLSESEEILRSPRIVVPHVYSLLKPQSVVDVGCGRGAWLSVFHELGSERILGLDGAHVDPSWLLIPTDSFRAMELTRPFRLDQQFDLAICLEVAEHLSEKSAAGLVASLARLAPCILFSAAIPCQGGVHHVNEQWPEYWQKLFAQHQFRMLDLFRKQIWKNQGVKY